MKNLSKTIKELLHKWSDNFNEKCPQYSDDVTASTEYEKDYEAHLMNPFAEDLAAAQLRTVEEAEAYLLCRSKLNRQTLSDAEMLVQFSNAPYVSILEDRIEQDK